MIWITSGWLNGSLRQRVNTKNDASRGTHMYSQTITNIFLPIHMYHSLLSIMHYLMDHYIIIYYISLYYQFLVIIRWLNHIHI